jgi:hypothetical protein
MRRGQLRLIAIDASAWARAASVAVAKHREVLLSVGFSTIRQRNGGRQIPVDMFGGHDRPVLAPRQSPADDSDMRLERPYSGHPTSKR